MEFINGLLNFDQYLAEFVNNYGILSYVILFLIIFCETGLVIATALPGDSLLFTAGALVNKSSLDLLLLWIVFMCAAVLGNSLNFYLGLKFGRYISDRGRIWFLKKEHFQSGRLFIDKYGYKAIVFARFIPIIRSLAPFLIGASFLSWRTFLFYNIVGAICWVSCFLFLGYFLGSLDFVEQNFIIVVLFIILISFLPLIISRVVKVMKKV